MFRYRCVSFCITSTRIVRYFPREAFKNVFFFKDQSTCETFRVFKQWDFLSYEQSQRRKQKYLHKIKTRSTCPVETIRQNFSLDTPFYSGNVTQSWQEFPCQKQPAISSLSASLMPKVSSRLAICAKWTNLPGVSRDNKVFFSSLFLSLTHLDFHPWE